MTVIRHYCTYFDQNYLPRGLALYQSLKQHSQSFCLWALCFDEISYHQLVGMNLQELRPISHEDFTASDKELLSIQKNRTLIEYYFTCTPSLPIYILNNKPDIDLITYLDADLYFFSNPEPIFDEIGSASIAIIPHRFPSGVRYLEENGIFNVGWLTFKRDDEGISCLQRWRDQCIEWCYDRIEGTRYADQGYLNDWPGTYKNLNIIQNKGANLAPWNISGFQLSYQDDCLFVEDDPLIFFHFQSLAKNSSGIYKLNFYKYKAKVSRLIKKRIYLPYIKAIELISSEIKPTNLDSIRNSKLETKSLIMQSVNRFKNMGFAFKIMVQGEYIYPWEYHR